MDKNDLKGIEQGRAIFAYRCVDEVCTMEKKIQREYKSYAKRIPTMIKNNGLGPALAFVYAKGEPDANGNNAYTILYRNIDERLKEEKFLQKDDKLIEYILKIDSTRYREISNEVLALFTWLRRFVDGMIEDEKSKGEDEKSKEDGKNEK